MVLVPALSLSMFFADGDRLAGIAQFDGVIVSPAALVSAIACYAAWRVNPRPGLAWTSFAVTLLGCQGLMLAAVQLIRFPHPVEGLWVLAADLTVALVILLSVTVGRHVRFQPDPAAAGFALGAVVAVLRLAWLDQSPTLGHDLPLVSVAVLSVVAFVVAAWSLLRVRSIPLWARQRTAVTVLLIGGAHVALYLGDSPTAHLIAIVGDTLGAVALVSTSLSLFFLEVAVDERNRSNLNDELERAQRAIRVQRAQFHEINSTIAGITSASRLLRSAGGITDQRRLLLEDMILAELSRLERLMARPADASARRVMDLDETIHTLVLSQQARGNRVHWSPCGLRVNAQPDAVAEVINILLDNAAKHGRSSAEVAVSLVGDIVEIAVHDDGPGVDDALRTRLFDWGARGPRSSGQGIGLHIAHELMQRQGGYLEIRDGRSGGATFVMGLPRGHVDQVDHHEQRDGDDDDSEAAADLA
ncbi:HAMP domain-containing sensor histidine kinase [Nocardioides sp. CER19]|uniref:sensor histidine kinase n=1 Tax=Nocardioides sp. CER19 TaxID=3038538 RepID=UPI00244A1880|nr:HAMP domain-containing sensor histidine kinase [Nocardioides sp. CER19]MDH2414800.1 ATP-binding protein [Nocardioides sp. CER19]